MSGDVKKKPQGLKELDGRVERLIAEIDAIAKEYGDDVALALMYCRPESKGKAVFAMSLHGNDSALSWTIARALERDPDLFLEVLDKIATMHPEMFRMHVVERPKPKGIVS